MASTNKTARMGLSQWEAGDAFTREDLNADFGKIDEAVGRVKLFETSFTAKTANAQIDLSGVDMSRFIELELRIYAYNTMYMRINGYSENFYYRTQFGSQGYTNRMEVPPGINRLIKVKKSRVLHEVDGTLLYEYCDYIPGSIATLDIFGESDTSGFREGDKIIIWGVTL